MGLMYGTGPLGPRPAGAFNFKPPPAGSALYLESTPKRIRVVLGGETIADSRRAKLLHESGHQPVYYFPPEDVRADLLEASDRRTRCPKKGEASYYTLRAGNRVEQAAAWYYPDPLAGAPPIKDLIAFYWDRVDHWLEEDEEVFGHARDPYHRIDVIPSGRYIRVSLEGTLLAEGEGITVLFESNLPPRYYLSRSHVVAELEPSDTLTRCPYKGLASYYSVGAAKDLVWFYPDPLPEASRIRDLLCFFNERVDLELDGELQERPDTPWKHGVKPLRQPAGRLDGPGRRAAAPRL